MYEEDAGATHVFNPDDPLMGVEWSVNVSDDETRTMRAPDIAFEYLRGGLDPNDTFVWRDGMGDWIPLGQCQELVDIIRQYEGGGSSPAPSQAQPDAYPGDAYGADAYGADPYGAHPRTSEPQGGFSAGADYGAYSEQDDDEFGSTVMMDPSAQDMVEQARQAQGVAAYPSSRPSHDEVSQTMASPFDMGDDDPFADARPPEAAGPPPGPRRVGERNEASALFSLDQIRAEAETSGRGAAGQNASGQNDDPFADIMSLGGGGGIAGAFAPPPIHAPAPPPPPPKPAPAPVQASAPPAVPGSLVPAASLPPSAMAASMVAPQQTKSRTGLVIGLVAAFLLVGGGVAAFALSGGSETTAETAAEEPAEEETASKDEETEGDEEKVAEEDDKNEGDAEDEEKDDENDKTAEADAKDDEDDKAAATTKTTSTVSSTGDDEKEDDKKDDKKEDDKTAKKDDKKEDDKKVAKSEFNRDAARSALAAAAGAASGCKQEGGPTGRGRVTVTFAPSGNATQATVGPPFSGTSVGSCAAGAFRGASVPPFSGGAVTVSKSFFIK